MMTNMEYYEPPFHAHYQQDQIAQHYIDAHHNYNMAQQQPPMIAMPHPGAKTNETKPRLGKDEVDILEREFKKNPKPTTQTKRQFAEDMGVDLARINNWFQNRRAKRKQEKKQEAYEAGQAREALGAFSAPSSPDLYNGNSAYFSDGQMPPLQQHQSAAFPMLNGPPPPVASFNPQYTDPPTASMESLQRTLAAAQAAEEFNDFVDPNDPLAFGPSTIHGSSPHDRAQFSAPDDLPPQFHLSRAYSYPSAFSSNHIQSDLYNISQSISELREAPEENSSQTPTPYNTYMNGSTGGMNDSQSVAAFPSQLLPPSQSHEGLAQQANDSSDSQSPEGSNESSFGGFNFELSESKESSISPPGPSVPFKSPSPMDIVSRRKKVQVKPAALVADTLKGRPQIGPRTASHAADGLRRGSDSPLSSPMRRIVSAGGNRNVLSGRIYKSGIESSQRSPINLGGFSDAGSFLEHNYHTFRNPPSLTGGSSLNSSLAPPTPMSPPGREMTFLKREPARSTASPVEGASNFVFNAGVPGCFTTMEGDQNLASPPETPQAQMAMNPTGSGWPAGMEFQEKPWNFDIPDEPLYTPGQEVFPLEIQMPQPSYMSSNMSQPVTPAFGQQFNPNMLFGHESPHYTTESPQYTHSTQGATEYSFPESQPHYTMGMSPMTKQKTFQFSHTTAADFSEK
jgi:hypothetical protein